MIPKHYLPYSIAFGATLVRYYDYAIFGLSASVLAKTFLPPSTEADQLLGFFAIFSISVVARPLGAVVFGIIGDRLGRIVALKNSTILGLISTGLIAVIPGYEVAGFAAMILLTLCRVIFLASLAGEVDALRIYIAERVGKKRRNLANGIASFCAQSGVLLAAFLYHLMASIDGMGWLWRLNFLIGAVLGFVIIFFRKYLQENDMYSKSKERSALEINNSLVAIIKVNKSKFLISTFLSGMLGGIYNFIIIFLGVFESNVVTIISTEEASANNIMLIATYGVASAVSGFIADRVNINKQIITAVVLAMAATLILQTAIMRQGFVLEMHIIIAAIVPFFTVPMQIKIQSLFSTATRMRLCSLSHSLGSMLFSSTTPFFCMLIWQYTQLFSMVLSFFMLQLAITFLVVLFMHRKNFDNMFEA